MAAFLGEVDARTLKGLFDLFELKTGIDDLITPETSMIEYSEFCALLERCVAVCCSVLQCVAVCCSVL